MALSPIKKIAIGMAALCVAITIMTANSLQALVLAKASINISNFVAGAASDGTSGSGEGEEAEISAGEKGDAGVSKEEEEQMLQDMLESGDAELDESGNIVVKTPETTEEIVEYYKKALNNAKENGKDVVRVKDGAINYKGVVRAGGLSSVAESLMGMFMASSADAIEDTNVEWKASDLPPAGVSCNLTAAGVKDAKIEDDGEYFIITIVANDCKNPKAGDDGVGSISSVIEESQITGAIGSVPGLALTNIALEYEEVTAIATVHKASGRLVGLTTSSPCYLSLDAKLALISINDACVGIQVISEFTVSY